VAGLRQASPLDFEFKGSFTRLADFFHRMKRFVRAANRQIVVRGRLIVINSFSFDSSTTFPRARREGACDCLPGAEERGCDRRRNAARTGRHGVAVAGRDRFFSHPRQRR